MKKKNYITPFVSFDNIEEETGLLTGVVSAGAENQEADPGGWDSAKRGSTSFFCIDDAFEGPIEEANEEFQYTLDF